MIVDVKLNEPVVPIRDVRKVKPTRKQRKQPPSGYGWDPQDEEAGGPGDKRDLGEHEASMMPLHREDTESDTGNSQTPGVRIDIRV